MDIEAQQTVRQNLWEGERSFWTGRPNVKRFAVQKSWHTFFVRNSFYGVCPVLDV